MTPGTKIDSVYIEDYHRTGPAYEYYGEDGPVVCLPQHLYVIYAETPRGELFMHTQHFNLTPEGKAEAEVMAAQVRAQGIIAFFDETWAFVRNVYGSQAYEEECEWMTRRQLAGEEG
mgnify:CR=1 FL=1